MAAAGGGCRLGGRPYDKSSVDSQFADDDDDGESAVLRPETSKSRDQIALETPKFWFCIWRRSQSRTRQLSFCARSTSQKFRLGSAGEATVSVFDRSPGHSFGLGISRENSVPVLSSVSKVWSRAASLLTRARPTAWGT